MIPILYKTITEGTVPADFGEGALTDCLKAIVPESRNGEYELELEYAAGGIHAEEIKPLAIIKAKPNYTDDPQLFEVYKVGKVMNGRFTVNARHISYRLSNKVIESGSAGSCVAACALLEASAGNFTITTDKTAVAAFRVSEPSSVRSWFGGKAGSLLDKYGGEWKYDNFSARLLQARGMDRGVTIRYAKNLTQLSQEVNIDNLATAILPYYKDTDGNVTTGAKVSTGLILDTPREYAHDFSQNVDPESATPIINQLATLAANYVANNNLTVAINSIKLDFAQLEGLTERVDLCDTVKIYFEALGISASAKCIKTVWDVLRERYQSCKFGDPRVNIADTITTQAKEIQEKPSRSLMQEAIDRATALISGNLGGYVVLHDSNGDGEPDEILIMDTADITTATKVWRWNKNGLGYSSNGYAGPFGLAMTADGEIVADFITTGTLNADLIKAGVIEDVNHNSTINMTTGVAVLKQLKAKQSFRVVNDSNVLLASVSQSSDGGFFQVDNSSGQPVGTMYATSRGAAVAVGFNNGHNAAIIFAGTNGGNLRLYDANDNPVINLDTISSGGRLLISNISNQAALALQADAAGGGLLNLTNGAGVTCFRGVSDNNGGNLILSDTAGNPVINLDTISSGGRLSIQNVSNQAALVLQADAAGGGLLNLTNGAGVTCFSGVSGNDGGRLILSDTAGNQVINLDTISAGGRLQVQNVSNQAALVLQADAAGGGVLDLTNGSGVTCFRAVSDDDGGLLQLKNTAGGLAVQIAITSEGGGVWFLKDSNGTKTIEAIGETGEVFCVLLHQSSSRKIKENIKPIEDARKILELEAVSFDFKNKKLGTDKRGFIAEDVQKVLPNLVTAEKDEMPAALDYIGMIPYLQQIIKEHESRIAELEEQIKKLTEKFN